METFNDFRNVLFFIFSQVFGGGVCVFLEIYDSKLMFSLKY